MVQDSEYMDIIEMEDGSVVFVKYPTVREFRDWLQENEPIEYAKFCLWQNHKDQTEDFEWNTSNIYED